MKPGLFIHGSVTAGPKLPRKSHNSMNLSLSTTANIFFDAEMEDCLKRLTFFVFSCRYDGNEGKNGSDSCRA